jgi:TetR/AcrR family transcriptional regulator of autoinduction and epiphytic fitness
MMRKSSPIDPRPRLSMRKRKAILEAAVTEFDQHGFQATSMDAVASLAAVSKRTIYNHFASKEELFRAIKNELVDRARAVDYPAFDPQRSLHDQLMELGMGNASLLVSPDFISLARVTIPAFLHCRNFASEAFTEFESAEEGFVRWIRAASRAGQLRVTDARRAAKQFNSLLYGTLFWPHIVGGQPLPSRRQQQAAVQAATELFLGHYRATSD